MTVNSTPIEFDFHGGVTLSLSGIKNGLIAAIDLGIVTRDKAMEISHLIREAIKDLQDRMTEN